MMLLRITRLMAVAAVLIGVKVASAVTLFSYDASTGQFPTDQGWSAFDIDTDGPLTDPNVEGTSTTNANAVIESVDGMNVLHIRDTLTDGVADLPIFHYPWTQTQQQMLINNGLKFTMEFRGLTTTSGGKGNVRFGFNGTEFETQADNINPDNAIEVLGLSAELASENFRTLEIIGVQNGSNFEFSYSVDGGESTALNIISNPSPGAIESSVYFGASSSGGRGTDILVKSVTMETLGFVQPQVATITRTAGSPYGSITLTNNDSPLAIAGYSILSPAGALNPANWTSVADNYDQSGDQSIDPNDQWVELSNAASREDLSEFEPDGDGATLSTGESISLGNVWIQNPTEDIAVELLLDDGSVVPIAVQFAGASRFEFGDLDFDGDFDVADFTGTFVPGFGATTAGMSAAERYQAGDFNEDDVVDEFDFLLYNEAYLAANPGAAALSMSAVPESSSLLLFSIASLVSCLAIRRSGCRHASLLRFLITLAALVLPMSSVEAAAPIAYWNFDEPVGATALEDIVGPNDSTSMGQALPGATGQIGGAWTFNNSNATGITIDPSSGQLTGLGRNYSFSAWVKSTDNLGGILGISDNTEGSEEVLLRVSDNGTPDGRAGMIGRPFIDGPGGEALSTTFVNDDVWHHVAFTSNASGWSIYVDGVRENSGSSPTSPSLIGANVVHIGINEDSSGLQWGLNGQLDDMVVWDEPLTDEEVADLYVKGLHGRGAMEAFTDSLTLEVNRTTGATMIRNSSGSAFEIDLYRIVSAGNSLQASNWNSFDDQDVDASAWTELAGGNGKVSEGAFGDSTLLGGGFARSLGNLNNTAIDAEDLILEYHLAGTPAELLVQGTVNYVTGGGLIGDYNADGVVNAADYTVWRDTLGQTGAGLAADGNNNGQIDSGDFDVWKTHFGETSGAGAGNLDGASSVPEPATILMCVVAAGLCIPRRIPSHLRLAAVLGLMLSATSVATANVTLDRDYRLGDDPGENGTVGTTVGSGTGGATFDSAGSLGAGDLQDLLVSGDPSYVNANRPGATGTNRGASFDGDGDALSTTISFHLPTEMWDNPTFFPADSFPHNYEGISAHGIQLWAKPDASGLGQSQRQDVVFDTFEQGIFITENDTWGLWYDLAEGFGIDSGVAVDTVANGGWTHVMQLGGADDPTGGASRQVGVLLVNGVAVAALSSVTEPDSAPLVIGASSDRAGGFQNHYTGTLDDVRLFLWGDNTGADSGDGRLGQNWGTLDLAVDNDWIAQRLAFLGVAERADVNLDGAVAGDGTGSVATDDVTAFVANWRSRRLVDGVQVGDWISRQNGDLNFDGIVDLRDAGILHNGLVAAGVGGGLNYALLGDGTVPEPSAALLVVIGLLSYMAGRRNRTS